MDRSSATGEVVGSDRGDLCTAAAVWTTGSWRSGGCATNTPKPDQSIKASRRAMAAASVRLPAPSLARMLDTWTLAVLPLMNSA